MSLHSLEESEMCSRLKKKERKKLISINQLYIFFFFLNICSSWGETPQTPFEVSQKNKKYSPNIQGFVLIGGRPPKPLFEVSEKKGKK